MLLFNNYEVMTYRMFLEPKTGNLSFECFIRFTDKNVAPIIKVNPKPEK